MMKATITLDEAELQQAVASYLRSLGHTAIGPINFERSGFPDSPDPRERTVRYSAECEVEPGDAEGRGGEA